ncbi:Cof-type HAD-IIB family hydrolase [Vibrio viridaestus]|uniref:HAD family hydrolase n=1 Tax=Vibrio viridaestus TaxID=2487322 RepID=A0A3N9TLK0_9VIBR|nr:Cof-type HAD-IIB family hydrolase [Vibrio viridaestus]RQW64485.1 HAD family hydrolase [Vibrio viridaestus]
MPKQDVKFIAADMDGTLLNEQSQLPERFFDVFNHLKKNNIYFAAASGRQYYSLINTFDPIKDEMLFIAENGTLVMFQGKQLYSCSIPKSEIVTLIEKARTILDTHLVLCGINSAYIETQDPQALKEFSKYYQRCQYVDDLLSVDDEFIKVAICHFSGTEEHVFPVMNPLFGNTHKVVVSGKIWLDVMNIDASKGAAIRQLREKLGFTFKQTMSFGDYLNDTEMLEESYYSYAMDNAHPKIKALARYHAPSNQDEGVLKVIMEQVLS